MTEDRFNERMSRQNLGELADDRITVYLTSESEDAEMLFAPVDARIMNPEDMNSIRSIFSEVRDSSEFEISPFGFSDHESKLITTLLTLREASDAMSTVLMSILHEMRQESDYSGLGLLYDACNTDQTISIYQRLGDMVFNDHFDTTNIAKRSEKSPLYMAYYQKFGAYFSSLIDRAESAWENYMRNVDEEDEEDDDDETELTYERFVEICQCTGKEENPIDFPLITEIRKRVLQSSAYLMALSDSMLEYLIAYVIESRHPDDEWTIANILSTFHFQSDAEYDDLYRVFCLLLNKDETE